MSGWFTYKWFTTGQEPPLISLPAHALANSTIDETPVSSRMINDYVVDATHPRYVSIPVLGIDKARVQQVGLTKNNTIDTPKNISDTAWYPKSAHPGQGYGAVVINGHNSGVMRDGVFKGLVDLKDGDQIVIERGDGQKITYVVVENKTEAIEQANTSGLQRIMTPYESDKEGLGLITDAGSWVPRDKVFNKKTLVRAVVVE